MCQYYFRYYFISFRALRLKKGSQKQFGNQYFIRKKKPKKFEKT